MSYKQNKTFFFFFFFDVMKNGQIFPSKVRHFQDDPRFLFSRKTGNIRRRYVCKYLLNLDCQDSIRFDIYQVAHE